ncbi:hypothetical protein Peur_019511 [Populus x canadensis]
MEKCWKMVSKSMASPPFAVPSTASDTGALCTRSMTCVYRWLPDNPSLVCSSHGWFALADRDHPSWIQLGKFPFINLGRPSDPEPGSYESTCDPGLQLLGWVNTQNFMLLLIEALDK